MGKRVLLIGGNFFPELTGIGKYNGEMMDSLAKRGYECSVITTFPYYPHWKIASSYAKSAGWFRKETREVPGIVDNPIKVTRCPHYIPANPTGFKRILSDFSFTFMALLKLIGCLFEKKHEVVIVVAPPFTLGILGVLYQLIKRAKFVYHIQDLQIDAARDFGLIKSPLVIKLLLAIEKFILRRADVVSSISKGMIKKIELKYLGKVTFFPNWVDTAQFFPIADRIELKKAFGFGETDKVILYSGAIGEKQGLEAILHAAKALEQEHNVKFVIGGSGPYKEKLEELKERLQVHNVFFFPLQPYNQLNRFLNMADAHLVLQKANAADLVMPSKLTAILAVGGIAIITASEGSGLHEVITEFDMGILIEPEDSVALQSAVRQVIVGSKINTSNNARQYAEKYLSIEPIFNNFVDHL